MRTEEDEAFDELARKQGAWGGGFKAKQAMAADKLQQPIPPNLRINCTVKDDVNPNGISPEKWRGQSNIESQHNACQHKDYCKQLKAALAQPAQEPLAYLCENAVGHKYFRWKKPSSTYKPVALYTTPQPCPTCEALARAVMMDQTGRDI